MSRSWWWVAGFLLCFFGGSAAWAGVGDFRLLEPGEAVPSLSLRDLGGVERSLDAAEDAPVLLYFWSVYCPNCKEAMPGIVAFHQRWAARGLRLWGVNVDGERFSNAVVSSVRDLELPFPVVYDRLEGEFLVAADPLGVTKTPTAYLVGPGGKVVERQQIQMDFDAFDRAMERLVGAPR